MSKQIQPAELMRVWKTPMNANTLPMSEAPKPPSLKDKGSQTDSAVPISDCTMKSTKATMLNVDTRGWRGMRTTASTMPTSQTRYKGACAAYWRKMAGKMPVVIETSFWVEIRSQESGVRMIELQPPNAFGG
jgi:hypothetical protein